MCFLGRYGPLCSVNGRFGDTWRGRRGNGGEDGIEGGEGEQGEGKEGMV